MKDFLRDNWIWIVVPFVLVLAIVAFVLASDTGSAASPFTYGQ